ncbi:MAG: ATP/GTP-binding protein [Nitrospinaceae bacterium]|nr:MAG: ATP/GTP-binding protein [Nitrospinaceae bacterium]
MKTSFIRPLTLPLTFLFFILFFSPSHAFQIKAMDEPHSFIVDPSTGVYYVSNVFGSPDAKDNNGFIAKIDPAGKHVDRDFIRSGKNGVHLDAPKGMALSGQNLYVTDIDVVRRFDVESGLPLGTVDFSILGAKSLHDLAIDSNGNLFVSDPPGNAIYRIDPANNFQVTLLVKGPGLGHPKALVYEAPHRRLLVATGFGKLIAVNMRGDVIALHRKRFKGLNGICLDREGNIILSSSRAGEIYRIKKYSTVEVIRKNMVTPAGISCDFRNRQVLVPSFKGNLVFTLPVK